MKVLTIEGYHAFCQVVADPTSPDTLFIAAIYKEENRGFVFLPSLLETRFWRVFSYNVRSVSSLLLTPSTERITRKIIIGMNNVVHLAARAIDPSYTRLSSLFPQPQPPRGATSATAAAASSPSPTDVVSSSTTRSPTSSRCSTMCVFIVSLTQAYDFYGLTIHPQRALVLTSDSKGSMQQWFVLQKTGTPTPMQEELAQANLQGTEVAWLRRRADAPPTIVSDSHPVAARRGIECRRWAWRFTGILIPSRAFSRPRTAIWS